MGRRLLGLIVCILATAISLLAASPSFEAPLLDVWLYAQNIQPAVKSSRPLELQTDAIQDTVDIECHDNSTLIPNLLGSSVSKIAAMYLCTLTNNGAEAIDVREAVLIRRLPQLLLYDRTEFQLVLTRIVNTSVAERIIRLLADPTNLFLVLGAARIVKMSEQILTGFAIYNAETPYIEGRIRGTEIPLIRNYQSLVGTGTISLGPGTTVTTHAFGAVKPAHQTFARMSVAVGEAPRVRQLR